MSTREPFWGNDMGTEIVVYLLTGLFLIGPGIFVYQAFQWLRTGYWTPIANADAFDYVGIAYPTTSWVGLQKVFDYLLGIPLALTVFLLSLLLLYAVSGGMGRPKKGRS